MASLYHNELTAEFPTHHFALSKHFFNAWEVRNELRKYSWIANKPSMMDHMQQESISTPSQCQFTSMSKKLQHLKCEIIGLMAQDTDLFQQLFALQEDILNFREQLSDCSSGTSSEMPSPCSTLSSPNRGGFATMGDCFARQRVSYPPSTRNRSQSVKTPTLTHESQDSYDSGIHSSDLEIFV